MLLMATWSAWVSCVLEPVLTEADQCMAIHSLGLARRYKLFRDVRRSSHMWTILVNMYVEINLSDTQESRYYKRNWNHALAQKAVICKGYSLRERITFLLIFVIGRDYVFPLRTHVLKGLRTFWHGVTLRDIVCSVFVSSTICDQ